MLKLMIH